MAEEYINQLSEEIEGRVPKNLSQEFSRMESRILGALSKLVEFLLNSQVQTCSLAVPGTSRSNNSKNGEPTGDPSLKDHCPEVVFPACRTKDINDPDQGDTSQSAVDKFWREIFSKSCI